VPQVAEIETSSWKGRERVARFRTPQSQELLRQALTGLGARDEMELWLGWAGDEAIAFEINFVTPERIWLYQGAYREEHRKLSPGAVLDFASIRRAWEIGVREYDFLSGDEAYKLPRTTAQRPISYLALFPATARGYAAFNLVLAFRWRLKGCAPARAALQLWVRRQSLLREAWRSAMPGRATAR
jgi:CelD/BcsL family acetyltransferase involved in cellulose biosynthesis